ncbi:45 kDa calcium-binding protein [Lingula anatina]|uniref:45 kDa calcium-binding protein n=1 Tax=Lingula anatina TaxID=7574 RepID=A0A1S3JMF7_LINAN|nr:45 kDa calcium-binding protein [Lingula anatina]|eukprot:XP_013411557.1 45 kDa calcium-binding protein [Lingula anatina]
MLFNCDLSRHFTLVLCITVIIPNAIWTLPIVPSNVRRNRGEQQKIVEKQSPANPPQLPVASQKDSQPNSDLKVKVADPKVKVVDSKVRDIDAEAKNIDVKVGEGHENKKGDGGMLEYGKAPDVKLSVKKLKPPDHLDAVKMEQDGHLNRDYKKEVLLGEHEEMEKDTPEEKAKRLTGIFHIVDTNTDEFIDQKEIQDWIVKKIEEHFGQAAKENADIFKSLDLDNDGQIAWEEFLTEFLVALNWKRADAEVKARDPEKAMQGVESEHRDQLITNKFRWAEADDDNDNKLTLEEFKNFMHPEGSKKMTENMVRDILENLDSNSDGILSIDEFAALPGGELDEQFNTDEWKASDKRWQDERKTAFREVIDINKDGNLTKDELFEYVNPKNPNNARQEAENLIAIADGDKDGKLSLREVLNNPDLFYGSKMINAGRNFHDEF